ncbi:acyl--CoA ligase [Gordonia sp. HY002]|uniref:class I adenylate-forming enzyme family protein n=1 Tax=Gordonia zhenghanii TaxID=2911516 RepID=UPI001EEFEBF8|nr:class I adenylate-forming enzyme family protein [Gordonia zhenghanii]MCF8571520.1 acyl--CoA ligase [Gordonia zhenghanii]MCF8605741.1 acyl--CoA ligase [Gordonia zhenghanii]
MTTANESVSVYREIEADLTGPAGQFAVVDAEVGGEPMRVYRDTPGSLDEVFTALVDEFGDATLFIEDGVSYSYRQVSDAAGVLAGSLVRDHGVADGARVGIAMKNRMAFIVSLIAIGRCGGVAVLFNSRESEAELAGAVDDAKCVLIIADSDRAARIRARDGRTELVVVSDGDLPSGPARRYDELLSGADSIAARAVPDPDSASWILFTSGTSGRSKGVVLTHRNLCTLIVNLRVIKETNIVTNARKYGMEPDALRSMMPNLSALLIFPLFHTSGLVSLLTTMVSGGFVVIMPRWDVDSAIELIAEHKLAMLAGPPMVIVDLLRVEPPAEKIGSLINVAAAGQSTPPDLVARIGRVLPNSGRGVGWGMTETASSVCTANGDLLAMYPKTSGAMSPVMDVRVVDAAGEVLDEPGATGELQVRGPQVMAGYLNRPDETAAVFDGSWYRSGDLGYVDDGGLVYVVDRKKDIVITAGENVYCAEVEFVLLSSERFTEVAVFGAPDERMGERVVAAVTLADGVSATAEDVRDLVRESLAEYKVPAEIVFDMGPFPRNATGKILKRKIRENYLG